MSLLVPWYGQKVGSTLQPQLKNNILHSVEVDSIYEFKQISTHYVGVKSTKFSRAKTKWPHLQRKIHEVFSFVTLSSIIPTVIVVGVHPTTHRIQGLNLSDNEMSTLHRFYYKHMFKLFNIDQMEFYIREVIPKCESSPNLYLYEIHIYEKLPVSFYFLFFVLFLCLFFFIFILNSNMMLL